MPSDFSSDTTRITGNLDTVTLPGGGLLVHDVGNFTFAPDGSILQDRGPKMLFSGQTGKLCAALARRWHLIPACAYPGNESFTK